MKKASHMRSLHGIFALSRSPLLPPGGVNVLIVLRLQSYTAKCDDVYQAPVVGAMSTSSSVLIKSL